MTAIAKKNYLRFLIWNFFSDLEITSRLLFFQHFQQNLMWETKKKYSREQNYPMLHIFPEISKTGKDSN